MSRFICDKTLFFFLKFFILGFFRGQLISISSNNWVYASVFCLVARSYLTACNIVDLIVDQYVCVLFFQSWILIV